MESNLSAGSSAFSSNNSTHNVINAALPNSVARKHGTDAQDAQARVLAQALKRDGSSENGSDHKDASSEQTSTGSQPSSSSTPGKMRDWDPKRFEHKGIIREADRNHGRVELAEDLHYKQLVAVKAMPMSWVRDSPTAFVEAHPEENELPWCDIAATYHLSRIARLSCVCNFVGVFLRRAPSSSSSTPEKARLDSLRGEKACQDEDETCLVMSYCNGGDLFSWLERSLASSRAGIHGACRETPARPLVRRLFQALSSVHKQGLAHGDLSLENVLLESPEGMNVILIDFGASTGPKAAGSRGKPSYQAPEMHTAEEYDAFLSDAFALGVLVFTLVVGDYPWESTRPMLCSKFKFFSQRGLAAYLSRRKAQRENGEIVPLVQLLSPEFQSFLEGLFCVDPTKRLDVDSALKHAWLCVDDDARGTADHRSSSPAARGYSMSDPRRTQATGYA